MHRTAWCPFVNVTVLYRGGVPVGGVTELVGPAGVGKSQLCHMLTVSACVEQQQQQNSTQVCTHSVPEPLLHQVLSGFCTCSLSLPLL